MDQDRRNNCADKYSKRAGKSPRIRSFSYVLNFCAKIYFLKKIGLKFLTHFWTLVIMIVTHSWSVALVRGSARRILPDVLNCIRKTNSRPMPVSL